MTWVLSSLFEGRAFYNWRMGKRGGLYMVGSLLAALAAGIFAVAARPAGHLAAIGFAPAWSLAGFVALLAVAALLWWRFSSLQDEMFHRIQSYSYGWGATVSIAILIVWGIANWVALAPPIDPIAPLLLFAIIKSLFWTRPVRTWL